MGTGTFKSHLKRHAKIGSQIQIVLDGKRYAGEVTDYDDGLSKELPGAIILETENKMHILPITDRMTVTIDKGDVEDDEEEEKEVDNGKDEGDYATWHITELKQEALNRHLDREYDIDVRKLSKGRLINALKLDDEGGLASRETKLNPNEVKKEHLKRKKKKLAKKKKTTKKKRRHVEDDEDED